MLKVYSAVHKERCTWVNPVPFISFPSSYCPVIICQLHLLVSVLWLCHTVLQTSCQGAPLIIAGCSSDELYYEHHQDWRYATNILARCQSWPIRWLKGRHTCLSRTLTLGMDFLQLPPTLSLSRLYLHRWSTSMTTGSRPGGKSLKGSREMLTVPSREPPAE